MKKKAQTVITSTMNKILEKEQLSELVYRMKLHAPLIARERKAGQFIIIQQDSQYSERIPLTIMDAHPQEGSIEIIYQMVGASTRLFTQKKVGDYFENVLGPLGTPTHIQKYQHGPVVCVAGGIGAAPLHPIAQALKAIGNKVIIIIGARNKELILLEDKFRSFCDDVIICTDDGSAGEKAVVTAPLERLCQESVAPAAVFTIGPPIMMKFCALTTKKYNVPTIASLNSIMIDGTGMCGCCRVMIDNKIQFACVDGPEFDAHAIDFDNLMLRQQSYKKQEEAHLCRLTNSLSNQ